MSGRFISKIKGCRLKNQKPRNAANLARHFTIETNRLAVDRIYDAVDAIKVSL
jgi:hypothetical protein